MRRAGSLVLLLAAAGCAPSPAIVAGPIVPNPPLRQSHAPARPGHQHEELDAASEKKIERQLEAIDASVRQLRDSLIKRP